MACTREYSLMGRNACVSKTLSRSLIAISHSGAKRISRPPFVSKGFSSLSLFPPTNFIVSPFHLYENKGGKDRTTRRTRLDEFSMKRRLIKGKEKTFPLIPIVLTFVLTITPPLLMELNHWKRFQETTVPSPLVVVDLSPLEKESGKAE